MILFWVLNIILWAVFAKYNYELLFKTKNFHAWGAVVSVVFTLFIACMIKYTPENRYVWESDFLFHFVLDLTIPVYMFMSLTIRWNVFDIVLNLLRGKKWLYKGETAYLDRIFTLRGQLITKAILLIITIYLSLL